MVMGVFFTKDQRKIFIGCTIVSSVALFIDPLRTYAYGVWLLGLPFICFTLIAYLLHGPDEKDVANRIWKHHDDHQEISELDFAEALHEALTCSRSFSELKRSNRSNEYIAWFYCARHLNKNDLTKIPKPHV